MREFHILTYNPDPQLASVVDYDLGSFDHTSLWEGRVPHGGLPTDVKLVVDESKRRSDYIGNPLSWHIVSNAFRSVLDPFWQGGTFIPVTLTGRKGGKTLEGYWLGAMATRVACLDFEKSVYRERPPGRISGVSKLVVAQSRVPDNAQVFVVAEWPALLVDGDVKQAIAASGVKGLALINCEVS